MARKKIQVRLSHAERARLKRLDKDVRTRLKKIANIVVRALATKDPNFARAMKLRKQPPAQYLPSLHRGAGFKEKETGIEIICFKGYGCGCYNHDTGVCSR